MVNVILGSAWVMDTRDKTDGNQSPTQASLRRPRTAQAPNNSESSRKGSWLMMFILVYIRDSFESRAASKMGRADYTAASPRYYHDMY